MILQFYFNDEYIGEEFAFGFTIDIIDNKVLLVYKKYHNNELLGYKWAFISEESIIGNNIVWRNKNRYSDNFIKYVERIIRNIAFL